MDFNKQHPLSDNVRRIEARECWWVYYDVDGYAPSDIDIVPCATEELAKEVMEWFKTMKDDAVDPYIVLEGQKYSMMHSYGVEGYMWATYYSVRKGEHEGKIFTSLADVVKNADIFDGLEPTTEADGVYYEARKEE